MDNHSEICAYITYEISLKKKFENDKLNHIKYIYNKIQYKQFVVLFKNKTLNNIL